MSKKHTVIQVREAKDEQKAELAELFKKIESGLILRKMLLEELEEERKNKGYEKNSLHTNNNSCISRDTSNVISYISLNNKIEIIF